MKRIRILIILITALPILLEAQRSEIEQELETFDQITFNGNFMVSLHQGDRQGIVLEGKEAVLSVMEIRQRNGRVTIGPADREEWKTMKKVYVKVYFQEMSKMVFNGISRVESETPLLATSLTIQCNGIRNLNLHLVVNELDAEFNGTGNTYLYGRAEDARIAYTGVGKLKAFNLKTEHMRIHSTGIGRVEVCALTTLDVQASGIGSVNYKGNPEIRHLDRTGIGRVHAMRL